MRFFVSLLCITALGDVPNPSLGWTTLDGGFSSGSITWSLEKQVSCITRMNQSSYLTCMHLHSMDGFGVKITLVKLEYACTKVIRVCEGYIFWVMDILGSTGVEDRSFRLVNLSNHSQLVLFYSARRWFLFLPNLWRSYFFLMLRKSKLNKLLSLMVMKNCCTILMTSLNFSS